MLTCGRGRCVLRSVAVAETAAERLWGCEVVGMQVVGLVTGWLAFAGAGEGGL